MIKDPPPQAPSELTDREREILLYIATGTSNKEIANLLTISTNTVKVHLRNIFTKIGVTTRTEAAMYAVRAGMVSDAEIGSAAAPQEPAKPPRLSRRWIVVISSVAVLWVVAMSIYLANRPIPRPLSTPLATSAILANRWKTLTEMPEARTGMAAAAYENKIYAIGGEIGTNITGGVEIYNTDSDSWSEAAPKPVAVTDINAVVIGGKIYVPGGRTQAGPMSKALEIYDPRLNKWEKGADLPVGLCGYALAALEGRLYLFGGLDDQQETLKSVYIYNPDQDTWAEGSPMRTSRAYAGAVVAAEKIYVIGGFDGTDALAINDIYSPHVESQQSEWETAAPVPTNIYGMGAASIADFIYLLGGKDGESGLPSPLIFVSRTGQWQTIETPPVELGNDVKIVPISEYIYVLGVNSKNESLALRFQAIYQVQIPLIP